MRFLCKVSSFVKISNVSFNDCFAALFKSSSSLGRSVGGFLPPYRFNCLLALSFHFCLRFEIVVHGHSTAKKVEALYKIPSKNSIGRLA